MAKVSNAELDFESLISGLSDNVDSVSAGRFTFKELTMKEQRKILNMGFNPIEIPARIENIFNEYISTGVILNDSVMNVLDDVTIDIKPFLIIQLRTLTLGEKYVDNNNDKEYTLYDVKPEDFDRVVEPTKIEFNNFIIRLAVPTLAKDTSVNNQLLVELGNFKKKLTEDDYGKVADLYQVYELMKYITEIEMNGNIFDFERCPVNKKNKIINSLPQKVVAQINDYVEKVKANEDIASTITEVGTNETTKVDMSTIFFVRNARDKK